MKKQAISSLKAIATIKVSQSLSKIPVNCITNAFQSVFRVKYIMRRSMETQKVGCHDFRY